jgi:hypothetical protein
MPVALTSFKGGNLISAEQKQENLIIYLLARDILKRLYAKQAVSLEVLERLNRKNAEQMGCSVSSIV